MWKEFKQFAVKGNVMDLAAGVIIGGAFGKIVTSLVNDLIMPVLGVLIGGVNFSKLQLAVGGGIIRYGAFIQSVVDFLIISFSIFMLVRLLMRFRQSEAQKSQSLVLSREEILLTEIRDLLREKSY